MKPSIVEIFKTNISDEQLAHKIVIELNQLYADCLINFDLEDCDNVLRVESHRQIDVLGIITYGKKNSIQIELIDY